MIRSSWLPHFCNSILPLSETDVLSISTWQLVVYRSKLNCEKLALYTLHTIGCNFKVWHFTNVKSTDTAIDLANFQERRQCGFLSMIIINEFYNDVVTHRRKPTASLAYGYLAMGFRRWWWHRRHPITKIRIFAWIAHMLLTYKRTRCGIMHFSSQNQTVKERLKNMLKMVTCTKV